MDDVLKSGTNRLWVKPASLCVRRVLLPLGAITGRAEHVTETEGFFFFKFKV